MPFVHMLGYERLNEDGLASLHYATLNSNVNDVKRLIELGVNVNLRGVDGLTALHFAAMINRSDILQLLLDAGADPNLNDDNGYNALAMASNWYYIEHMDDGASTQAQINARVRAAKASHYIVTRMLIDAGSSLKEPTGWTPLGYAIDNNDVDTVNLLIASGVDLNHPGNCIHSPLEMACRKQNQHIVISLCNAGADTNEKELLHRIINITSMSVLALMLHVIEDINAVDNIGCTALHYACLAKNINAVWMLLKAGADPKIIDKEGRTALGMEIENGNDGIVAFMRSH